MEAQINFVLIPKDFAIVPRNVATNKGTFRVSGYVTDPAYSTIEIRSYLNGSLAGKSMRTLAFNGSSAYFNLVLKQKAGLLNYDFRIYLNSTLIKEVKSVAFGDIMLITGQSNAVANAYSGLANSRYQDSFIRSFGTASTAASAVAADTSWYLANGDGYYGKGTVGQWGLIMAKLIMDSMQVPIGLINNAVGGTPITFHKKNYANPLDLNTSYGRHLYRATKAEVNKKARFMFYYQGESDGANARLHDSLFRIMHSDWRTDFPGLEKIYIVQVRGGCGLPSPQLREAQRQFEFTLPITRTLCVNGFKGHDGCHFALKDGYEALGFEAANCLLADFYTKLNLRNVYPLNPVYACISKSDYTQITLELNQDIQDLKADANFHQLFQLEGTPGVSINSGSIINNKIVLNLSGRACKINGLSYDGKAGSQAWVRNGNGLGLLTFYKLPVYAYPRADNSIAICEGVKFAPRIDTLAGYSYLWRGKTSGIFSRKAWPEIKPFGSEVFELIVQDKLNLCKADTQMLSLHIDSVKDPQLQPAVHLCPGDSFKVGLKYPAHSIVWKFRDSVLAKTDTLVARKAGIYTVDIASPEACHAFDTIRISQSFPASVLDSVYRICPGTSLTIKTQKQFARYVWNGDSTLHADSLLVRTGKVNIMAVDSAACTYTDSALVEHYMAEVYSLDTTPEFCDYAFYRFQKPQNCRSWYLNDSEILNTFYYFGKNDSGCFRLSDENDCVQNLKINPIVFSKPGQQNRTFRLCEGQSEIVQLNQNFTYFWADAYSGSRRTITRPGIYPFTVLNNNCGYEDSILIWTPEKPYWNIPADTIVCEGDYIQYAIPGGLREPTVNGKIVKDSVKLYGNGLYLITAYDTMSCAYQWHVKVAEKTCILNVKAVQNMHFVLFPNPVNDHLFISADFNFQGCVFRLYDHSGKELPLASSSVELETVELDLSALSSGVYVLKISGNGNLWYYKVLKD